MTIVDYLQLVALEYIPPTVMALIVGYAFSSTEIIFSPKLILAILSACFIVFGYNSFNAVYDKEIDRINKPHRPVPRGAIDTKTATYTAMGFFLLSIMLALLINWTFLLICLVAILFAIAYSHPRLYLKKHFLLGIVLGNSIYAVLFPLAGWALVLATPIPWYIILFLFFFGLGTGILKDFEDLEGDMKHKIMTLPHVLGIRKAALVSMAAFEISSIILILMVFLGGFQLAYLLVFVFITLSILNAWSLLNNYGPKLYKGAFLHGYSSKLYKGAFLNGMFLLALTEIIMVAIWVAVSI
jgi:geranylgeranylglycerol-phosphate geranylgeranyltransferase